MGAAVLNVVWQVFSRHGLAAPSSFTEELARMLLMWMGLLGAAYASGRGMHLAIDLLPRSLEGAARVRLERWICLAILGFALGAMVWGGSRLVWMTFRLEQLTAAMRIPLGYVYLALPISGLLMSFYAWADLTARREAGSGRSESTCGWPRDGANGGGEGRMG
jgi:TRAP-type C4-dicarboxylate transport system permease small subunit